VQTPLEAKPIDINAVQSADLFFLIMGADIRAPVGLELHFAKLARRKIIAFLQHKVSHTPAGQVFVRQAQVDWRAFAEVAQLSRQAQRFLVRQLLDQALHYLLTPTEVSQLETILAANASLEITVDGEGTGRSAVLLSRERYEPREGIIVEDS
jgi:hypothetical protein